MSMDNIQDGIWVGNEIQLIGVGNERGVARGIRVGSGLAVAQALSVGNNIQLTGIGNGLGPVQGMGVGNGIQLTGVGNRGGTVQGIRVGNGMSSFQGIGVGNGMSYVQGIGVGNREENPWITVQGKRQRKLQLIACLPASVSGCTPVSGPSTSAPTATCLPVILRLDDNSGC